MGTQTNTKLTGLAYIHTLISFKNYEIQILDGHKKKTIHYKLSTFKKSNTQNQVELTKRKNLLSFNQYYF